MLFVIAVAAAVAAPVTAVNVEVAVTVVGQS